MKNLIKEIKENNQDFEFYPTTKEIIKVIYNDLAIKDRYNKNHSILDIGCGNGNFFTKFKEIRESIRKFHIDNDIDETCYNLSKNAKAQSIAEMGQMFAIEKSEILLKNLPKDVVILGTDFYQQTLIDKNVDIIFSNPPYSEFEDWSTKIIKESYCNTIYLVIPDRWVKSEQIKAALKLRNFTTKTLGSFDFLKADRQARAKVNIVKITKEIRVCNQYYGDQKTDPFEVWFEEEFKIELDQKEEYSYKKAEKKKEEIKSEIIKGSSLIETLTNLYNQDMLKLLDNYKAVCDLDIDVLKELGVSIDNLKEGLKSKIKGLKILYWRELFDNFDKIKSRLTFSKRNILFDKLNDQGSVDFTESNIYAIVIWVIKNANQYFDEQLKEIYLELTETDFVKKYKSNQRTWQNDRWRYKQEGNNTHYTLDYRIITHQGYKQDQFVSDVETIASNLGFNYIGDVKKFKNGNIHFKFEKEFIKAFNIEAARLFGWINEPQDILNEFEDITQEDVDKYFKKSFTLDINNKQLLLT